MALRVAPAGPSVTPVTQTQLLREFVVSGRGPWYGARARALGWPIDDLTGDLGIDLYERMLRDPQVAASLHVYKASIIEDGVTFSPAKTVDSPATAKSLAAEAQTMLANLETPIDDVLWNMLDAAAMGNKVAELKWRLDKQADGSYRLNLAAIKPKPIRSTAFVVDPYMNVVGLTVADAKRPYITMTAGPMALGTREVLPREKFCVLTFRPVDSDPRGTSILRPAYDAWLRKREVLPEYVKYLTQFASPSLIGNTSEGALPQVAQDADGNPVLDANGAQVQITAEEALALKLADFHNGTALALPYGSQVNPIQSEGDGKAFITALTHCDQQIVIAILTQTLATMEAEHQARAAAQVHQDVLDTIIRQGKKSVVRMILWDIIRLWILYNWGPELLPLMPQATLGTTEQRQIPQLIAAVAQLVQTGFFQPDQYQALDEMCGLPVRDLTQEPAPIVAPPEPAPAPAPAPENPPPDAGSGQEGGPPNATA